MQAPSYHDAYIQAVDRHLPPVLGALAELTSGPVVVEIVRIGEDDGTGFMPEVRSPDGPASSIRGFDVKRMTSTEHDELIHSHGTITKDETARHAARDLLEAIRIMYLSGGVAANLQATLLRYFFVVEHISRKVGYNGDAAQSTEKEQAKIVSDLRAALNRGGNTAQLVKKLQKANGAMQVVERRHLSAQIRHTGEVFQLNTTLINSALELAKLRNSRLGHAARTDISSAELEPHVAPAELVSRAFFNGYLRYLR